MGSVLASHGGVLLPREVTGESARLPDADAAAARAACGRCRTGSADVRALLAEQFRLTPEELVEVLPSGRQRKFDNRAAWATTYLVQAGLLERPRRGVSRITARGLEVLRQHPQRIDISVLAQFDEFRRFRQGQSTTIVNSSGVRKPAPAMAVETPEEALETAYQEARATLAKAMLSCGVASRAPGFGRGR
jgi:restriction system protein